MISGLSYRGTANGLCEWLRVMCHVYGPGTRVLDLVNGPEVK